jgi:hypothetical protein
VPCPKSPCSPLAWLQRDRLLSEFASTASEAIAAYRRFVAEGAGEFSPWGNLKHQVFLGSQTFVEAMRRNLPNDRDLSEIPRAQRRPLPKGLAEYAKMHPRRDDAIAAAYAGGGYTMKAIGEHFGLHYSQVNRMVNANRTQKTRPHAMTHANV